MSLLAYLWRHGWPSRVIELPSDWWEQTCELESGLWIVTEEQSPEHLAGASTPRQRSKSMR